MQKDNPHQKSYNFPLEAVGDVVKVQLRRNAWQANFGLEMVGTSYVLFSLAAVMLEKVKSIVSDETVVSMYPSIWRAWTQTMVDAKMNVICQK